MMDVDDRPQDGKDSSGGTKALLVLIGLLFLPALVVTGGVYSLFRNFRQRISVVLSVVGIMYFLCLVYALLSGALPRAVDAIKDFTQLGSNWGELIPLYAVINIALGGLAGLLLVFSQIRQMKANPHRLRIEGNWMYKFAYHRTPFQVLRRKRTIEGLKSGAFSSDEKTPLGLDETSSNDAVAYRYYTEAVKQSFIVGASGSGKTITMMEMMLNDIIAGKSFTTIDFKRSPEMAAALATWCKENGRNFYHYVNGMPSNYDIPNSAGQAYYDPLISGGASKADMLLNMREYDRASAVYQGNMRQLLQVLFSMLRNADRSKTQNISWGGGSLRQVASAIDGNLAELAAACEGTEIEDEANAIEAQTRMKSSQLKHALEELQGQIRTLLASEYGRWLKVDKKGRNINLFKLMSEPGNVVLFSLNADSEKDFSRYMGSLILSDLNAVSALRRTKNLKNHVNIYVDEFQAVPPTAVTSLLEKSRGSVMGMTLSSQSFEQVISSADSNGEAYLVSIMDTCSNFFIHAGSTEDSAVRLSKILGKRFMTVYRQANQNQSFLFSSNWGNRRNQTVQTSEEERWILPPNEFMSLSSPNKTNDYRSTAIIINKSPDDPSLREEKNGPVYRRVWMIPNRLVLDTYYTANPRQDDDEEAPMPEVLASSSSSTATIFDDEEDTDDAPRDLLSEHAANRYDPAGTGDDDEDGGFGWESNGDDDETEEEDDLRKEVESFDVMKTLSGVGITDAGDEGEDMRVVSRPRLRQSSFNSLNAAAPVPRRNMSGMTRPEPEKSRPVKSTTADVAADDDLSDMLPPMPSPAVKPVSKQSRGLVLPPNTVADDDDELPPL